MGACNSIHTEIKSDDNIVVKDVQSLQAFFEAYYSTNELSKLLDYVPIDYNYVVTSNNRIKISKSSNKPIKTMYYHMNLKFDLYDRVTITVSKEYNDQLYEFMKNNKTNTIILLEYYRNKESIV